MRKSVSVSSKKCMLTLSTACQVKAIIRKSVFYDSANKKERLSFLKEMHAHSHYCMSGKARRIGVFYDQPIRRSVSVSSKKCMLPLRTACQVKAIRKSVFYDSANKKERLSVLKQMHAPSQYCMSGKGNKKKCLL